MERLFVLCTLAAAIQQVMCNPVAGYRPEFDGSMEDGNYLRHNPGGNQIVQLESLARYPAPLPYGVLSYGRNKKNFDEIDRTGFGRFVKRTLPVKKNFDEIDNVGFRSLYSF